MFTRLYPFFFLLNSSSCVGSNKLPLSLNLTAVQGSLLKRTLAEITTSCTPEFPRCSCTRTSISRQTSHLTKYLENNNLKQHKKSVHEGNKPFKCEVCDFSSSRKIDMKRHVNAVHEGKKPFKCEICDYRCSRKNRLKQHIACKHVL